MGLLDDLNKRLSNLSPQANLGLLATGASLLSGQPLDKSISTGLGTFQALGTRFRTLSKNELEQIIGQKIPDKLFNENIFQINNQTGQITTTSLVPSNPLGAFGQSIDLKSGTIASVEDGEIKITPIAGGKAEKEITEGKKSDKAYLRKKITQVNVLNETLNKVKDLSDGYTLNIGNTPIEFNTGTGFEQQILGNIGGSKANEIKNQLLSFRSILSLGNLEELRKASPTGGSGLGSTSDNEIRLLEGSLGSIDPTLPKDSLIDNMTNITDEFEKIRAEAIDKFFREYPEEIPLDFVNDYRNNTGDTDLPEEDVRSLFNQLPADEKLKYVIMGGF